MQRLAGKNAVITGGSRGIGAAVARALAEQGATVMVVSRKLAQVQEVADELSTEGYSAHAAACDVSDEAQVAALAEQANATLGQVDILVNNAGIAVAAPVKATTLADWNRVIAVNATGTFLCTRALMPAMAERGWGRVVNVASVAGLAAGQYVGAYAASKHAVIGFTRAAAAEVATRGVTVNAVCPGYVDTAMTDATLDNISAKTQLDRDAGRAMLEKVSPQGRLFEPEEVAYLVLCLCDPRARGVNGHALVLDGGALLTL
jgi:NAD(P)-dependent dehydrogenase (short-subunit alcohol dehydrogenase family)